MLLLVLSKFAIYRYSKIHFMHLQQYNANHCVYLARIRRHSEKSRRKRDHACAA